MGDAPVFPGAFLESLENDPASVAFEQGERRVRRGELLAMIRRVAAGMRAAGLGPGRGVAIRTGVTPEAFAAHMAAHALGCRVVGVRPGYPAAQLAHVLGAGNDALVVDGSTASPELFDLAGALEVLSLGPCPGAADLLAGPDGPPLAASGRPDDVAVLAFTSGSTGRPKGCAITYRALRAHWAWEPDMRPPVVREMARGFERYLLFGTLASLVVMEFLGACLVGGGAAVIAEDDGRPAFPYAIERYGITGSIATVPKLCRMLDLLRDAPADVGSLRALMVSGSPLPPHRLAEAVERLGPVVYQGYGQTEAGSISMLTPADIAGRPERALTSVGRPHPAVEVAVRDAEGRDVGTGREGEIHVRSPYLMSGYWDDPDETRDVLRDGWLRTRDLGRTDEDGFLHLSGRTRDAVMVNAMVVYAGPIERALAAHPGVDEAYVAGAPDERTGEAVHAFVVPARAQAAPDPDALRAWVRAELGDDSAPRTVTFVPEVPVAPSGKPDKRALLALLAPHAGAPRPGPGPF